MKAEQVLILVAEDNETLRFLVQKQLSKLGFQADFVINGKEAVRQASIVEYSLILMDIMMPEMDGYEAFKSIREQEIKTLRKHSPVIAMTACTDKNQIIEAGMDDYVFKPVMLDQLKTLLDRWLPGDISSRTL